MIEKLIKHTDKVYKTDNFITKKECDKFIEMVSHLKLPDDADFENEYKPYWEYRLEDISNNPIIGKVSNYFKKHLDIQLIINQAQIQVWIPGSYSTIHTHDEDGFTKGREDTYWNSLLYLNDVDSGGEFFTEHGIEIKPKAGTLTLFDGKNIKHGINEVKNNNRYTIIFWWK